MPTPPLLHLRDVRLTFGATPLLTGADLAVAPGARIGLVGRNGSGKSTLMRIAAGLVEPDGGEVFVQPGTTVRYLPQEPDFGGARTTRDYAEAGLQGTDDPHRVTLLLEALGLTGEEAVARLSGGEARRAALVRTLAPDPDVLLLDEPTNHLDLPTIEWLEGELARSRAALVLISHDRRFLERLTRETAWVDRGGTRLMERGFAHFEDWRDTVLEQEERDAHKLDRKIVREEHWVTHGVSGRRKRNVRRLAELAELKRSRTERVRTPGTVDLQLSEADASAKLVIRAEGAAKTLGGRALVREFDLRVSRGDRIGIVGSNGAGKTTLVRLMTGEVEPDAGRVKIAQTVDMLVVDQKRDALSADLTVRDALTGGGTDLVRIGETTKHVMAYMKDFLFLPEQAGTPVERLSGGERGRLVLAMKMRHPSNLLVLDEPTNDLDLETLDLLQERLATYEGTVILVSHDRDFIDRVCDRLLVPEGDGRWTAYAGGWSDMLAQRGGSPFATRGARGEREKATRTTPARSAGGGAKMSFKDAHALEALPGEIEKLEAGIARVNEALADPTLYERDPKRFGQLMRLLEKTEAELAAKEERWLELEERREALEGAA